MSDPSSVKFVVAQLFLLASVLNELALELKLPAVQLSGLHHSVVPTNIPVLLSDTLTRVAGLSIDGSSQPTQGAVGVQHVQATPIANNAVSVSPAPALSAQVVDSNAGAQASALNQVMPQVPSQQVPVAVPAGSPQHVDASTQAHSRRKRDVSGVVSEIADTVGSVASSVQGHSISSVPGVSSVASAVQNAAERVEWAYKPDSTFLGEMLLSN